MVRGNECEQVEELFSEDGSNHPEKSRRQQSRRRIELSIAVSCPRRSERELERQRGEKAACCPEGERFHGGGFLSWSSSLALRPAVCINLLSLVNSSARCLREKKKSASYAHNVEVKIPPSNFMCFFTLLLLPFYSLLDPLNLLYPILLYLFILFLIVVP